MRALDDIAKKADLSNAGRLSPVMESLLRRVAHPLVRVFHRPSLEGIENLPSSGPFLLVANHSAGLGLSEIVSFAALYVTQVGAARRLAGFAHPTSFGVWPMSAIQTAIGAIPSTYAAASETIERGVALLVFPGGDHETLRPVWHANTVDFGGRVGFLKIAKQHNIPIVPMGIRNAHYTAPMLARSRWLSTLLILPRFALGTKRWALSVLGVLVAIGIACSPLSLPFQIGLIWLWLGSPLVMLPFIPATLYFKIGKPITAESLFSANDLTRDDLTGALSVVETAVQRLIDR